MNRFEVNQRVVCIVNFKPRVFNTCNGPVSVPLPKKDEVYTIDVLDTPDGSTVACKLKEFPDLGCLHCGSTLDGWFPVIYFKPLEEKKTDITVFQNIRIDVERKHKLPEKV